MLLCVSFEFCAICILTEMLSLSNAMSYTEYKYINMYVCMHVENK